MRTYTVYLKQDDQNISNIKYVPEKFSWPGFLFSMPWLIYHKLWVQVFLFIVFLILLQQLELAYIVEANISVLVYICVSLLLGFTGNDILRRDLEKRGYIFYDVVIASSEQEAELKFICNNYQEEDFNA